MLFFNQLAVIKLNLLREPRIDGYLGRAPNSNIVNSDFPMQWSSCAVQQVATGLIGLLN